MIASHRRGRAVAGLLALAVAGVSLHTTSVAFAQMDADTKEAKVLFEKGVELYKAGKFEEARVKFKAAYGLKKRPSILINLARAELQTKQPLNAAMHFKEAAALPDIKPEDKEDAKAGLLDARKQLGVILIDAPVGATVQIDGATVTGYEDGVDVVPGSHSVSVKAGGKETNEKVSLDAGKSASVKLKSDAGGGTAVVVPPVDTTTGTGTGTTTGTGTGTGTPTDTGTGTTTGGGTGSGTPTDTGTSTTTTTTTTGPTTTKDTNQPGFFASIHPVTYVAAGVTVVSAALWIGYFSAMKTHQNNTDALAAAVAAKGSGCSTSPKCQDWKAQGRDEVDMFNTDKTLSIVFGVTTFVAAGATVVTYLTMRKKAPTVGFSASPTYGGAAMSVWGTF